MIFSCCLLTVWGFCVQCLGSGEVDRNLQRRNGQKINIEQNAYCFQNGHILKDHILWYLLISMNECLLYLHCKKSSGQEHMTLKRQEETNLLTCWFNPVITQLCILKNLLICKKGPIISAQFKWKTNIFRLCYPYETCTSTPLWKWWFSAVDFITAAENTENTYQWIIIMLRQSSCCFFPDAFIIITSASALWQALCALERW